jgi:hypothetical protein
MKRRREDALTLAQFTEELREQMLLARNLIPKQ